MQPNINKHILTREQALARIVEVVHKGARHVWYQRTTDLAGLYRKLVTGDGLNDLLQQFVSRETDEAFKQRCALTQHTVTTTTKNIMDVFYKVPRSNYQRVLEHSGATDGTQTTELEGRLKKFWGIRSLDNYVQVRWLEMNSTDPNAFVVVEFKEFDYRTERASPYPFEVDSFQAVDYAYENNVLKYLIVKTTFPLPTKNKPDGTGDKYTVYLENETFVLMEVDPATRPPLVSAKDGELQLDETGGWLISGKRLYALTFSIPHNAGEVPAKQVGYARDAWTGGQTFVSPYESAVPLLKKSIKVNSELDITMSQQVFPHRLQYMPKCGAPDCHDGYTANGIVCDTCKGRGHTSVTSAMDVIYIKMPKNTADLFDLEKLLVFKGPPMDVVSFQDKYVDKLTAGAKAAVFNSESFTREQVQETATGKNLDRDNVQDTLYTCAMGYAETWAFLVRMTAAFTQLDKDLDAKLVFSKDFKLKGITELVADLEAAKRSEAGPAVVQNIQNDMARLMYSENPDEYNRWATREKFNPFSGMNADMVSMALSDSAVPQKYKVRYLMLGVIFSELEAENPAFYKLAPEAQAKLVDAKVAEYMADTKAAEKPIFQIPPTNGK